MEKMVLLALLVGVVAVAVFANGSPQVVSARDSGIAGDMKGCMGMMSDPAHMEKMKEHMSDPAHMEKMKEHMGGMMGMNQQMMSGSGMMGSVE